MGGKSSAPAAPDYVGLAQEQGKQNRETAQWNNQLGKVNTNSPWGSTSWDGNNYTTTLSPSEQAKLNSQNYLSMNAGNALTSFLGNNPNAMSQSLNLSGAPSLVTNVNNATGDAARNQAIDAIYGQYKSRLDPQFAQQQTDTETDLINKGYDPTSEGYGKALDNFNRAKNDAYQTAQNNAVTQGNALQQQYFNQAVQAGSFQNQARDSYIQQQLQKIGADQNTVNYLRSMLGVNMPGGMSGTTGNAAPADLTGAANNQYQANINSTNVDNANASQTWSNIGSMAGIAAMFLSDARLKSNIEKVGETDKGVGVYEYDIGDRRERGVLAQEVERRIEGAVHNHPSGFKMVDYSKVGKF